MKTFLCSLLLIVTGNLLTHDIPSCDGGDVTIVKGGGDKGTIKDIRPVFE